MFFAALLALPLQAEAQTTPTPGEHEVPTGWSLKPSGLRGGDAFRLLFVSSTKRGGWLPDIGAYDTHVQDAAQDGHSALEDYADKFQAVACTAATDARDHTATTGTGVAIYWVDGSRVADDYADFYDGNWDSNTPRDEDGDTVTGIDYVFTGCHDDGTEHSEAPLGTNTVASGVPGSNGAEFDYANRSWGSTQAFYGLSPVFRVETLPLPPPLLSQHRWISTVNQTPGPDFPTFSNPGPFSMPFTTGSESGGYPLTSVDLSYADANEDSFTLSVCTTASDGYTPTTSCMAMTAPSRFAAGIVRFTAPANTTLAADTTYTLVMENSSGLSLTFDRTSSTGEDTGGADGWSVGDRFALGFGTWSRQTGVLLIAVNGSASDDATLGALALTDANGDAVALNEAFAPATTTYTAGVEAGTDVLTLAPETAHDGATIEYLDGTGATLADADANADGWQVLLDTGENPIGVKVTAQDDATTVTYTLTVTRALPALSFAQNSVTVSETDGVVSLTLYLVPASAATVTVDYATRDGTALADDDYGAASGTLTFAPGETAKTVGTQLADDQLYDPGAVHFFVDLTNASGATLPAAPSERFARVDIASDESEPVATMADVTADEGAGTMTLTLELNRASTVDSTYSATSARVSGTATSGGDYTDFLPGGVATFTVAAGERSADFDIALTDDAVDEVHETIIIGWDRVDTNVTPAVLTFTGTIADNDTAGVTVSKTALTVTEEDAAGDSYTVVLDSEPTADVTVTVGGYTNTDVTPTPAGLTFTALNWGTPQEVTVTAAADSDTTSDSVTLTHAAASSDADYSVIAIAAVAVTVADNDTANTAATGAPTVSGTAQVDETLTASTSGIADANGLNNVIYTWQWVRVDADGVSNPEDIAGATGSTYTLAAADVGGKVKVEVSFTDDAGNAEGPLASAPYPSSGTVTALPVQSALSFAVPVIDVNENGVAGITVNLSPASSATVTVGYATRDAGAVASDDYTAVSGTLTFTPGETAKTITVPILDDDVYEPNFLQFNVDLSNASGATLPADPSATVRIRSEDPVPTASMEDVVAGERGGRMRLTLVLDRRSAADTHYVAAPADVSGTATSGDDYDDFFLGAAEAVFTVPAGDLRARFDITLIEDMVDETDETIVIAWRKSPRSGVAPAVLTFTGTITGNASPMFPNDAETRTLAESFGATFENPARELGGDAFVATDADDDPIRYSFEGADAGRFEFDSATGRISTRYGELYDYEAKSSYGVTVKAEDGNGGVGTVDVTIELTDDTTETPRQPTGVQARWMSTTSLVLAWTVPENEGRPAITGYEVDWGPSAGGPRQTLMLGASATGTTLTGLEPGTEYGIQVRAVNAHGGGAWAHVPGKTNAPPNPVQVTHYVDISEAAPVGTTVAEVAFIDPEGDPIQCRVESAGTPDPATGLRPLDPRFRTYLASGAPPKCVVELAREIDFETLASAQLFPFDLILRARDTALENDTGSNYGGAATITVKVDNVQEGGTGSIRLDIGETEAGLIVPGTVLTVTGSVSDPDGFGPKAETEIPLSLATWHYAGGAPVMEGMNAAQGTTYTVRHEDAGKIIHARVAYDDVLDEPYSYMTGSSSVVAGAALVRLTGLDTRIRSDEPLRFTVERERAALGDFDVRFMIEVVNGDGTTTVLDGVRTIPFPAGQSSVTYDEPLDGTNPNRLHTRRVSLLADDAVPVNYALAASDISGDIMIEPVGIRPDGLLAIGRAPGASGDYAVGEVLEVDTSGISDKGGLDYVYTSYEWIRTDVTTGAESIVQRGSGTRYTVGFADAHHKLHAKAYFTTTTLGYSGSRSTAPVKVAPADGSRAQPLRVLDVSPGQASDAEYSCGDSLSIDAQFNGAVPGRSSGSNDLRAMRLRVTLSGQTLWFGASAYVNGDSTRVRFHYNVKPGNRTSSLHVRDFLFEGTDRSDPANPMATVEQPGDRNGIHYTYTVGRSIAMDIDGGRAGQAGQGTVRAATYFFPGSEQTDPVIDCSGSLPLVSPKPLTAIWERSPANHDGATEVSVEIRFSAPVEITAAGFRDEALSVTGGSVEKVKPENILTDHWAIRIKPDGPGAIGLVIGVEPDAQTTCASAGALCTADGRMLMTPLTLVIPGPGVNPPDGPVVSIDDAQANENTDLYVVFRLHMSVAASEPVFVRLDTESGTATGDEDYRSLDDYQYTFVPGQTEREVRVPLIPDSIDEDAETFSVRIATVTGAGATIGDGEAVGTIKNTDHMPQAWLARFGRTVAEQVVEAIEGRMAASRAPGFEARLAGQALSGGQRPDRDAAAEAQERRRLERLSAWLKGEEEAERPGQESRPLTGRDLLAGSSFTLTEGTPETGFASFWARAAIGRFDGRAGDLSLDGDVTTGMLGADWTHRHGALGLLLAHSRGSGGYRGTDEEGKVESELTGLYPWGRYEVNERVAVWGVAGYGAGTFTLTRGESAPLETDMALSMASAGVRAEVVRAHGGGGPGLALEADALGVRTSSEAAPGLAASRAEATRVRVGVESTWELRLGSASRLAPRLEVGVRHDGGDAETGFGADFGAGLAWSAPGAGLQTDIRARGLLTHEAGGFRDRGISGQLAWDPRPDTELGPSLALSQTMGAEATGGMDSLLTRRTLAGLGGDDEGEERERRRFEARLGYGLPAFGGRYTGKPELGLGLGDTDRELGLGWRLAQRRDSGLVFDLGVKGTRREQRDGGSGPEHGLTLDLGWRLVGARYPNSSADIRFEAAHRDVANDGQGPDRGVGVRLSVRW